MQADCREAKWKGLMDKLVMINNLKKMTVFNCQLIEKNKIVGEFTCR